MYKIAMICGLLLTTISLLPSQANAQDCSYWYARVGVKNVDLPEGYVNEKDPDRILEAVECLLKLEGDKSRGAFGRAAHTQVSEQLPMATVEICALYYISKLFYQKYDHANGVVLVDRKQRWNTAASVTRAYISYKKWCEQVKEVGLENARMKKLDPLDGSGVRWY